MSPLARVGRSRRGAVLLKGKKFRAIPFALVAALITGGATHEGVTSDPKSVQVPQAQTRTHARQLPPQLWDQTPAVTSRVQVDAHHTELRRLGQLRQASTAAVLKILETHPQASEASKDRTVAALLLLATAPSSNVEQLVAEVFALAEEVKTSHERAVADKPSPLKTPKPAPAPRAEPVVPEPKPAPAPVAQPKPKPVKAPAPTPAPQPVVETPVPLPAPMSPAQMRQHAQKFVQTLPNSDGMHIRWNDPRLDGHLGAAFVYGTPGGILVNGARLGTNVSLMEDVIRHEAGHVYQHRYAQILGIDFWELETHLRPAFGTNAIEKAADCVALHLGASWTHYTKKCGTPAQEAWVTKLIEIP